MDWNILKTELTDIKYKGLSDEEVAKLLNNQSVVIYDPIPSTELLAWAAQAGRYVRILKTALDTNKSDEIRSIAYAAIHLVERDGTSLDLNLPDRMALLDALVQEGTLIAEDKQAIIDIAVKNISRTEQLGIDSIGSGDVNYARSLNEKGI